MVVNVFVISDFAKKRKGGCLLVFTFRFCLFRLTSYILTLQVKNNNDYNCLSQKFLLVFSGVLRFLVYSRNFILSKILRTDAQENTCPKN